MSLLQEMQTYGLADCKFNRELLGDENMKEAIEIDENVFSDQSMIINFNQYANDSKQPSHVGGYVRITKDELAQNFSVIVFSVDGDLLSETLVPFEFIAVEDL